MDSGTINSNLQDKRTPPKTLTLTPLKPVTKNKKATEALFAERVRIYKLPVKVQSLVGIKGIYVLVEALHEPAKSVGLTDEQLQMDIELKLRLAGIKVNSHMEWLASKDKTFIYVNINANSNSINPSISYCISVKLNQTVTLVRSPYAMVQGVVWDRGSVGKQPKSRFKAAARRSVNDFMDEFINDYLTANPKK